MWLQLHRIVNIIHDIVLDDRRDLHGRICILSGNGGHGQKPVGQGMDPCGWRRDT